MFIGPFHYHTELRELKQTIMSLLIADCVSAGNPGDCNCINVPAYKEAFEKNQCPHQAARAKINASLYDIQTKCTSIMKSAAEALT